MVELEELAFGSFQVSKIFGFFLLKILGWKVYGKLVEVRREVLVVSYVIFRVLEWFLEKNKLKGSSLFLYGTYQYSDRTPKDLSPKNLY